MFDRNKGSKQSPPRREENRVAPEAPRMGSSAPASSPASAVIGPGIEISGDVKATADLVINGKVKGSVVQSSHSVEIGESGQVMARIGAKLVKISGEVRGDVVGDEKVFIARTGRVLGNISAPRVQLDDGALFKGSIDMTPPEPAKPAKPAKPETQSAPPVQPAAKKDDGSAPNDKPKPAERKEPSLTLKSG